METPITPPAVAQSENRVETKLKNSFALIILLIGLFAGSLFVDIGQLITGSGFSGSALREQTVLETAGKTWVAYTAPAINVQVITDKNCFDCAPDEALLWMRRILPTLRASEIAYDSFEGKELIVRHNLISLPAFIFDQDVKKTDFYAEAAPLFTETDNALFFDMNKIGLPVGKYLQAPEVGGNDIRLGNPASSLTVTLFSDFACEYCREFHVTFKELVTQFGDRVQFVFKHFPLPMHPQAERAALAASCAQSLDAFLGYSDILFERQADWTERSDATQTLKNYAWRVRGMNGRELARCMDENRFGKEIEADRAIAERYNLQAAPAIFVGDEFVSGAIPKEELETMINEALTKAE